MFVIDVFMLIGKLEFFADFFAHGLHVVIFHIAGKVVVDLGIDHAGGGIEHGLHGIVGVFFEFGCVFADESHEGIAVEVELGFVAGFESDQRDEIFVIALAIVSGDSCLHCVVLGFALVVKADFQFGFIAGFCAFDIDGASVFTAEGHEIIVHFFFEGVFIERHAEAFKLFEFDLGLVFDLDGEDHIFAFFPLDVFDFGIEQVVDIVFFHRFFEIFIY